MKIVDACRITGRGEALITDEPFTIRRFIDMQSKKKARVAIDGEVLDLKIIGAEAVLKSGGREFFGFLVPFFEDETLRASVVNREIEVE
jgi:hypothetical protein